MDNPILRECPSCGFEFGEPKKLGDKAFHVYCRRCGVTGPSDISITHAIERWNQGFNSERNGGEK